MGTIIQNDHMMELSVVGRVQRSLQSVALAGGDLVAIAVFVAIGEVRHGGTLGAGVLTYTEFIAGWAIAGVLLGAYAPDAVRSRRRAAGIVLVAWTGAALLGQLIRAVLKPGFFVSPSFVGISIVFGGIILVTWRVLAVEIVN